MPFVLLDVLRAIWALRKDRSFVVVTVLALVLVIGGSMFYWRVEDLHALDAVYLSVMTLATVGYGDVTPATAAGKVFTMLYVITGMGILVAFVTAIAGQVRQQSLLHRPLASLSGHHRRVEPHPPAGPTGEYDVLVIGAGEAGRETAIAAARLGLRVVVADAGHSGPVAVRPHRDSLRTVHSELPQFGPEA